MKTKTVYVLRVGPNRFRSSYRTGEGTTQSTIAIAHIIKAENHGCLKCKKIVNIRLDYVVMRTRKIVKTRWWEDYAGSVCQACFETADEYGRISLTSEEAMGHYQISQNSKRTRGNSKTKGELAIELAKLLRGTLHESVETHLGPVIARKLEEVERA